MTYTWTYLIEALAVIFLAIVLGSVAGRVINRDRDR